jgi:hypothetical protein
LKGGHCYDVYNVVRTPKMYFVQNLLFLVEIYKRMKYTTIKTALFILCFGFIIDANSQSFIFTDIGNSILTRPNIGYEYRWKKSGVGASIQYQRNAMFWITEFPNLIKISGLRLDLTYKFYFKSPFFLESKLRTQFYDAPFLLIGWHGDSIYNSNRSIEFAEKIGFTINKTKQLQFDFSAGIGGRYSTKTVAIGENEKNLNTLDELKQKYYNQSKETIFGYLPHVQLRMFYRIR